jgi:hypothetical protein
MMPLFMPCKSSATPDSTGITKNTSFVQGLFAAGNWCRPFWADMHSTITKAEVAFAANNLEYDWAAIVGKNKYKRSRPFVFANVGKDVPVWAGTFANGKYGFSIMIPYLVDVWLDLLESTTRPVINTQYRFGVPELNFIHHLDKSFFGIKNYAIKISLFKHECGHIGDDLTQVRSNAALFPAVPATNAQFVKLDISYNYWQVEATINDAMFSQRRNHSLRAALLMLHSGYSRFYRNTLADDYYGTNNAIIAPAQHLYEFWLQYQWQSGMSRRLLQWIGSVEARWRIRYVYPYLSDDGITWKTQSERLYPCINAMFGVRYRNPAMLKVGSVGAALRAYYGVNPYGQFRSIPQYWQVGAALVVE